MNLLDLIIITPLALGLVRGLYNGFINELASLVSLIAGIFLAYYFSDEVFAFLSRYIENAGSGTQVLSYLLIFVLVVICIQIISRALTKVLGLLALGLVNRLLGGLFGLLKMVLILLITTHFVYPFLLSGKLDEKPIFTESYLFKHFIAYSDTVGRYLEVIREEASEIPGSLNSEP